MQLHPATKCSLSGATMLRIQGFWQPFWLMQSLCNCELDETQQALLELGFLQHLSFLAGLRRSLKWQVHRIFLAHCKSLFLAVPCEPSPWDLSLASRGACGCQTEAEGSRPKHIAPFLAPTPGYTPQFVHVHPTPSLSPSHPTSFHPRCPPLWHSQADHLHAVEAFCSKTGNFFAFRLN